MSEYIKKEDAIKAFEKSLLGKYILWDTQDKIKKDMQERISQLPTRSFPEELSEDGTLTVHVSDGSKVSRVFVMGDNIFGGLYYPDSAENKGEWIDNGNGSYTCSNCKTEWTTSQIEKMCFCPTCGADMRGETRNESENKANRGNDH